MLADDETEGEMAGNSDEEARLGEIFLAGLSIGSRPKMSD